jgi:hypothetical protein
MPEPSFSDIEEPISQGKQHDSQSSSPKSSQPISRVSSPKLSSNNSEDSILGKFSRKISPSSSLDSSVPRRLIRSIPDLRLFRFARKKSKQQKELARVIAQEQAKKEKRDAAAVAVAVAVAAAISEAEESDQNITPASCRIIGSEKTDLNLDKPGSNITLSATENNSAFGKSSPAPKTPFKEKGGFFRNWRKTSGSEFFEAKPQLSPRISDKSTENPEDQPQSCVPKNNSPHLERDMAPATTPGQMTISSFKRHSWDSSHSEASISKPSVPVHNPEKNVTSGLASLPTPDTLKREKRPGLLHMNVSESFTSWLNKRPGSLPPTPAAEEIKP